MNDQLFQKQQYLRQHILEAGYNAEEFIDFLGEHTGQESHDIQELTLEEVKQVVIKYHQKVKISHKQPSVVEKKNENNPRVDLKVSKEYKKAKSLEDSNCQIDYGNDSICESELNENIECIEIESLIKQDKIEIEVICAEDMFQIKSNATEQKILRSYEDFIWFYKTISRLYPTIVIPEIHNKTAADLQSTEQKEKARRQLENFMRCLCGKSVLKVSYLFADFLTVDYARMGKQKKNYDSMGFVKAVPLFKNRQGFIAIELSNRTRQILAKSEQFSKKKNKIENKILDHLKKVYEGYGKLCGDCETLTGLLEERYEMDIKIGEQLEMQRAEKLERNEENEFMLVLKGIIGDIASNMKGVERVLKKYSNEYFEFDMNLNTNLARLQSEVRNSESEYINYKMGLRRKKQKNGISRNSLFAEGQLREVSPSKYQKEEAVQNELKYWYAFSLKNYENELKELMEIIKQKGRQIGEEMLQCYKSETTKLQEIR